MRFSVKVYKWRNGQYEFHISRHVEAENEQEVRENERTKWGSSSFDLVEVTELPPEPVNYDFATPHSLYGF